MQFGEQILAVVGVLGLLALVVLELKRRGRVQLTFGGKTGRARQLELIERLPLTPQHSVHLIRVANRRLLIGVSPSGCSLLDSGATPAETVAELAGYPAKAAG